jgi:hypothetical protein
MQYPYKIVRFDEYCKTCTSRLLDESEEPCNTCLEVSVREGTREPLKYVKDTKKRTK